MQLRLYAKYYRSMDYMILPDGFEARVSSYERRDRFINKSGVIIIFTFVISLPVAVLIIFLCYIRGIRHRLKTFLEKPDYHSTQAALVCVSQTYTLFVAIMDTLAVTTEGIAETMKPIIGVIITIEYVLFSLNVVFVIIFACESKCCPSSPCCELLRSWFVVIGIIPSVVCL